MTDRELRLRERIDRLIDERDAAFELYRSAISDNEDLERKLIAHRDRRRERAIRTSRDMWRRRAQDAEAMLNQIHQHRRRKEKSAA